MGKTKLRESKICENCGATVEVRYCSTCGQENSVTRQSFIIYLPTFRGFNAL